MPAPVAPHHTIPCSNASRASVASLLLGSILACRERSLVEPPATAERAPALEPEPTEVVTTAEQPTPVVTRTIDDAGITGAVERELAQDHLTPAQGIRVATHEGVVELTGTVDNLLAQQRATRIAELVRGVRSVSNRIDVRGPEVPDAELTDRVRSALLYDPVTESYEIVIAADDGAVTLSGTVGAWAEKQIAEQVAASVVGVTRVDNQIDVADDGERADAEILREIARRLANDVLVDHQAVAVAVVDGDVVLSGTVGSAAERTRAMTLAWTAGVDSVDAEGLEVNVLTADPNLRKQTFVLESEDEIAAAIRDALRYDPRVDSFELTPVVRGTTVTLQGTVDNLRAKRAAVQLARNTVGVARVVDAIEVAPPGGVTDEEVAQNIRARLATDVDTDAFDIQVDVDDGVATLTGTVDDYFAKAQAGDLASLARGVTRVDNLLQVRTTVLGFYYDPYLYGLHPYIDGWEVYRPATTATADAALRDDIERELFWTPFVDADQVDVRVEDGTATLTGTVDSWREREAASENAYEGGALYVDNLLHVEL